MNRFWNSIMCPIIKHISAKHIIEVGSDEGTNTKNILNYCVKNNAILTAIDPCPNFNVKDFKRKYREKFNFKKELSLKSLPKLSNYDVILLDGDHNWYTIYNELKIIEKTFLDEKNFPLIFMHDVSWPYARRDMYYNPETIPHEYRQYYEKLGMDPNHDELVSDGGLNAHLFNAYYSNTQRNGVLTGAEDFLNESDEKFSFIKIPIFYGLGIIFKENKELEKYILDIINNSNLFELAEKEHVKTQIELKNTIVERNNYKNKTKKIQKENETQINQINTLKKENETQINQINTLKKENFNQNSKLNNLEIELDSERKKNMDYKNKYDDLKINNDLIKTQQDILETKNEMIKRELYNNDYKLETLKKENINQYTEITNLNNQIKKNNIEIKSLKSERDNLKVENIEQNNKINQHLNINKSLNQKITELQNEKNTNQKKITELQNEKNTNQKKITELLEKNSKHHKKTTKLQMQIIEQKEENKKLEKHNKLLSNEKNDWNKEINELTTEMQILKSQRILLEIELKNRNKQFQEILSENEKNKNLGLKIKLADYIKKQQNKISNFNKNLKNKVSKTS